VIHQASLGLLRERPGARFYIFLEWCINVVGAKEESARGYFRYAGLNIEFFLMLEIPSDPVSIIFPRGVHQLLALNTTLFSCGVDDQIVEYYAAFTA